MIQAIALLVAANGAPVLINKALGKRWAWPVDNKLKLRDGRRLFGNTKTWRGLCSAVCVATLAALFKRNRAFGGGIIRRFGNGRRFAGKLYQTPYGVRGKQSSARS